MTSADDRGSAREIALGLVAALAPVLADVAAPAALGVAREAAQILSCDGLDGLLAACAPHAGRPWPPELLPALERVRRLAAHAAETGDVAAFRDADRELAGLANEVAALQWSPAAAAAEGAPAVPTLSLADALDEVALADDASRELARRARLGPPAAGALRAALDWLVGDLGRPIGLREDDSVLEVQCERVEFEGIAPAGEVLAAVHGNLGPSLGGAGAEWLVRVPLHTEREAYLMLVHGGVAIAIPWHAVLRLRMAAAAEVAGRQSLGGWPIIESPLGGRSASALAEAEAEELPLALIAHGRKRGWLVADRLVWRLSADRVEPGEPAPAPGLTAMVQTEEGERYWLAEPEWLLHSIEAPALQRASVAAPAPRATQEPPVSAPASRETAPAQSLRQAPAPTPPTREPAPAPPRAEPPSPPSPSTQPREMAPVPAPAPPPRGVAPAPGASHLRLLRPEDVQPIEEAESAPAPRVPVRSVPALETARPVPIATPPAPVRAPDSAPGAAPRESWPAAAPRPIPPPPPAPVVVPGSRGAALVAEDSLTARVFLTRLLERLGFEVCGVDSAVALRTEFERASWSLACVDVGLPDEEGTAFLARLASHYGGRTPFVALVRDAEDRVAATRAGIERMLRKPFDYQELEQVLRRLGLIPRKA